MNQPPRTPQAIADDALAAWHAFLDAIAARKHERAASAERSLARLADEMHGRAA